MTNQKLRELCVNNNWFIDGSVEQYDKLFACNSEGVNIITLAYMIWLCSNDYLPDIMHKLKEAEKEWQRVKERCENEQ